MALPTDLFVARLDLVAFCTCYSSMTLAEQAAFRTLLRVLNADRELFDRYFVELCFCCAMSPNPGPQPQPQPLPGPGPTPGPTPRPQPQPPDEPIPPPGDIEPAPLPDALLECIGRMLDKMCAIGPEKIRSIAGIWKFAASMMDDGIIKTLINQGAAALARIAKICDDGGKVYMTDIRGLCLALDAMTELSKQGLLATISTQMEVVEAFMDAMAECCAFPGVAQAPIPPWMAPHMPFMPRRPPPAPKRPSPQSGLNVRPWRR